MYAFLKGVVEEKKTDSIVLEVNGIGYSIYTTTSTLEELQGSGASIKLYTYLHVREDNMTLYGFISKEERQMFEKLISVSGIGPRGAIGILSALSPRDLALALVTDDFKTLTKIPGIGKKTAQRLVLELKEKIDNQDLASYSTTTIPSKNNSIAQEAIHALMSLGYGGPESIKAVESVAIADATVEDMILLALKSMDKQRK